MGGQLGVIVGHTERNGFQVRYKGKLRSVNDTVDNLHGYVTLPADPKSVTWAPKHYRDITSRADQLSASIRKHKRAVTRFKFQSAKQNPLPGARVRTGESSEGNSWEFIKQVTKDLDMEDRRRRHRQPGPNEK